MNAAKLSSKVSEIIEKMVAAKSQAEIDRLYEQGYEYARGSNSRKERLQEAKSAAVARIASEE